MNKNYVKMGLSRSFQDVSGDYNNHGDCHTYGIMSGCDDGCPALIEGKCENIEDVLKDFEKREYDKEILNEIRKIYKR